MLLTANLSLDRVGAHPWPENGRPNYLVSCVYTPSNLKWRYDKHYQTEFLDVKEEDAEWYDPDAQRVFTSCTYKQAREIAAFIKQAQKERANVFVNCHAGISRSGAVVDILTKLGWHDMSFPWQRIRHPNPVAWNRLSICFPETINEPYPMIDGNMWEERTLAYVDRLLWPNMKGNTNA